jgi:hypothetical protein
MRSAKHAKRTVGFNIIENLLKSFQQSLLESFYPQESIRLIWEFPNPEKLFPELGTLGEGDGLSSNIRACSGNFNVLTKGQYGKEAHDIFTVNFFLLIRRAKVRSRTNVERT